ncbi:hypothetical protein HanRHA438_Chr02g0054351 [Helianthus annuus]|nr:hypothetical protein HanRHA438_Chr02g0054351 [Helianthus annuus]
MNFIIIFQNFFIIFKVFIICEGNVYEQSNRMKNLPVMLFTHTNPRVILNRYHITHSGSSLLIS